MVASCPDATGTLERARRLDTSRTDSLSGTVGKAVPTRQTKQKNAIRRAFLHERRPLTAEEVRLLARDPSTPLSLATVYRNLRSLVEERWLEPVELPGRSTVLYEMARQDHHHYFECRRCKAVYELEGCCLRREPSMPPGFTCSGHAYFVFGVCAMCRLEADPTQGIHPGP